MNKDVYIKSLPKVKLVIGNGFDLHCGLHTTYSDYFRKYYEKYHIIQSAYEEYEKSNELNFVFEDRRFNSLNIWDVFFALNNFKNPRNGRGRWCDIEKMISASFINLDEAGADKIANCLLSEINWNVIIRHVATDTLATNHMDRFVVALCKEKMKNSNVFVNNFYQFLLDELKEFEKSFGNFIYYQFHIKELEKINSGKIFLNEAYMKMASDTLSDLCNKDNLVGIDSFNYSSFCYKPIAAHIQHINGSCENPIFGIDTVFRPDDKEFIFTKTSRRIDIDLVDNSFEEKPAFENLIIFGHSLNEADYSYFFPVFDKLRLTDSLASNTVVFAYSIFDDTIEIKIKSDLRKSISNILYAYAKSKNISNPERFLDSLSTQKRIIMYEIPRLDRNKYQRSLIDEEWDDIYNETKCANE